MHKCHPKANDDCIFKTSLLESTICEGNCRHSTENIFSHTELRLQVEDLINTETITGLLEKTQIPVLLEGCQCGNVGTSRSADLVTQTFEIMIFHLNYSEYNAINKIIPNLNIHKE